MSPALLERPVAPRPPPPGPRDAAPRAARWPAALRALAFGVLLVQGAVAWSRQLEPAAERVALQGVAVALALACTLVLAGRLGGRRRTIAVAALCAAAAVAAVPAAGIPAELLRWRNLDVLASGIAEGLGSLPDLNIPYRGLDEWVRWTLMSGSGLLCVLAAALAYAPGPPATRARRSLAAAGALAVLYGVAIVERDPDAPFRSGLGWTAGLALFLGAERLRELPGPQARGIAVGIAAAAVGLAGLLAPALDGARPLVDYRSFGADLAARQDVFDWNHRYAPLRWPRDGRELLRVRAKTPAYWKATVLPRFDGLRWVENRVREPGELDTPLAREHPEWFEDIAVTVRALRSEQYLTAGWTSRIFDQDRQAEPAGSGSFVTSGRPLKSGDTYSASVYVPRPTSQQLREAGTAYPGYALSSLTMELPPEVGGPEPASATGRTQIQFQPFGALYAGPIADPPGPGGSLDGGQLLARSAYRRTWAAAQALRAGATSPFALLRSVRRRVQQDAQYTETPRQGRVPLDAFLWDTREGYCQQFSGAMALLLRMTGIPARVASGFAPGKFDADRGSYVVRDLDAHSWVEAFFPGIGWVTFDPTPTIAPPNSQSVGDGGERGDDNGGARPSSRADAPTQASGGSDAGGGTGAGAGGGSGPPWVLLLVLVLAAGAGAAAWALRRPHTTLAPLEELRRALARSGRPVAAGQTLERLERSFAGSPGAQGYIRKLSQEHYAGTGAPPTAAERAALRCELAAGLGLRGRLRSWWALPPQRRPRPPGRRALLR